MAETWRRRWDSFHLVTPNWTLSLPGAPYDGDDPEGFVARDEIVAFLERYAAGLPVRTGVAVNSLEPGDGARFLLRTSDGDLSTEAVIICTGAYQRPHRPTFDGRFPPEVTVLDAEDYHNPSALPAGRVMVVGSGQTGCQIAKELCESGREVFLACGRAGWGPRRPDGRDIVTWLDETTWFRTPVSALPTPQARLLGSMQGTGKAGGHDLHYRTLQAMGVELLGRLTGVEGHRAGFADDLVDSVAWADARYAAVGELLAGSARRPRPALARTATVPRPPTPRARPPRVRNRDLHVRIPPRLRPVGAAARLRPHGFSYRPRRSQHDLPRTVLLRRPLPADEGVLLAVRGRGGRQHRRAHGGPPPFLIHVGWNSHRSLDAVFRSQERGTRRDPRRRRARRSGCVDRAPALWVSGDDGDRGLVRRVDDDDIPEDDGAVAGEEDQLVVVGPECGAGVGGGGNDLVSGAFGLVAVHEGVLGRREVVDPDREGRLSAYPLPAFPQVKGVL